MKEKDLIRYIKHEIKSTSLNEMAGDISYEEMTRIFNSFKNIFSVVKTAIKSTISTLALGIEIIITFDEKKYERIFDKYEARSNIIRNEYDTILKDFNQKFEEYKPLLLMTYPGAYISYELLEANANNFYEIKEFLVNTVGVDVSKLDLTSSSSPLMSNSLSNFFRDSDPAGRRPGFQKSLKGARSILRRQRSLEQKINAIFGLTGAIEESVIISESKDENLLTLVEAFKEIIPNQKPEFFGIKENTKKDIESLKKNQIEEFLKILEIPEKFSESLTSAKDVDDVKQSIQILKDFPIKIGGIEKINKETLEQNVKKSIEDAKKKNKLKELFKELKIDESLSEEEKLAAIKAYQLKMIIGKSFLESKKEIADIMMKLKEEFSKKLVEDTPLDQLEKIAPGSDLEKILKEGLKKIENSGKRQAK